MVTVGTVTKAEAMKLLAAAFLLSAIGCGSVDVPESKPPVIDCADCDDKNPCTSDLCVEGVCEHAAYSEAIPCSDKFPNKTCSKGVCQ